MQSVLTIEHGELTCALEPGKFCRFLGAVMFGTMPVCRLFDDHPLFEINSGEKKGWVERCEECKTTLTTAD